MRYDEYLPDSFLLFLVSELYLPMLSATPSEQNKRISFFFEIVTFTFKLRRSGAPSFAGPSLWAKVSKTRECEEQVVTFRLDLSH